MAVKVDVCERPGVPCLESGCTAPARFWVQRDDLLRLHYCGPGARKRIATHQRMKRELVISDAARRLLDEVWL
jgi:hypothetical protein